MTFQLDPRGMGSPLDADLAYVDTSLAYLVQRMLPVADMFVRVSWFVERRGSAESGLTSQALVAAVKTYVSEHMFAVLQLEDKANAVDARLTLQVIVPLRSVAASVHVPFLLLACPCFERVESF